MRVDFGLTCETAVQVSPARVADARSTSRPSVLAVPLSWLDAAPDGVELCVLADGMRLSDKVDHRGIALLLTTPATATAASGEADIQAALRGLAKHADTVIIDMGTDGAIAACDGMIERIDEAPRSRHASDIAHQLFCGAYLWAYVRGLKPTERLRWAMLHASRGDVP